MVLKNGVHHTLYIYEVKTKSENDINSFQCQYCEEIFPCKAEMKKHIRTVHKKPHVCSTCGMSFKMPSRLKYHISAVHEGIKPFSCSECSYTCAANSQLTYHIAMVHEKKKPYVC